jgi:hypothetical protein
MRGRALGALFDWVRGSGDICTTWSRLVSSVGEQLLVNQEKLESRSGVWGTILPGMES